MQTIVQLRERISKSTLAVNVADYRRTCTCDSCNATRYRIRLHNQEDACTLCHHPHEELTVVYDSNNLPARSNYTPEIPAKAILLCRECFHIHLTIIHRCAQCGCRSVGMLIPCGDIIVGDQESRITYCERCLREGRVNIYICKLCDQRVATRYPIPGHGMCLVCFESRKRVSEDDVAPTDALLSGFRESLRRPRAQETVT